LAEGERRRYTRFQLPVRVAVKGRGLAESCVATEVGMGGCRLILSRQLPEGTSLQVELSVDGPVAPVGGAAQVAWAVSKAPWDTGLSFAPALVEAMGPFLRALVGGAPLTPPPVAR
jgi:hypothetical protein